MSLGELTTLLSGLRVASRTLAQARAFRRDLGECRCA